MAGTDRADAKKSTGPSAQAQEVFDLVKGYARQETVDPLKRLGGFLKWGVPGAVVLTLGLFLLNFALLRLLQTQTGTALTGSWSWVPYVAVMLFDAVCIAIAVAKIKNAPTRESHP